jgi:hypothetical protein
MNHEQTVIAAPYVGLPVPGSFPIDLISIQLSLAAISTHASTIILVFVENIVVFNIHYSPKCILPFPGLNFSHDDVFSSSLILINQPKTSHTIIHSFHSSLVSHDRFHLMNL